MAEEVVMAFRLNEIVDREMFSELDVDEISFRKTMVNFGVDESKSFAHKRELTKLLKAWKATKIQVETKQKIDAVQRAHGEPVQTLVADWNSMICSFKDKYGSNIHDSRLPAQSYFDGFEERLSDGSMIAEPLTHVVSMLEEQKMKAQKPEPARTLGINLDSSLTIQTRRRYVSAMPSNFEELRTKYKVMTNMWLLAQMRQPGRHMYLDFDKDTFNDFLDELISSKNFLLEKTVAGKQIIVPQWDHCLNYEQELRNEAVKRVRELGLTMKQALWAAYKDDHHRMENWQTLLTIANSGDSDKVKRLENKVTQLESKLNQLSRQRSRSPRGNQQKALPAPQAQLALPAPSGQQNNGKGKKGKGKGKGKSCKGKGKQQQTAHPASSVYRDFATILKRGRSARSHFFAPSSGIGPYFAYQSKKCSDPACQRPHVCIGCGKQVPYDECGCLESKVA